MPFDRKRTIVRFYGEFRIGHVLRKVLEQFFRVLDRPRGYSGGATTVPTSNRVLRAKSPQFVDCGRLVGSTAHCRFGDLMRLKVMLDFSLKVYRVSWEKFSQNAGLINCFKQGT